ncbi:hypothetical protein Droror1_Dr00003949 [Drosera rotundifolia]
MASGSSSSSGRANIAPSSKPFDFSSAAADDILCSYDDYRHQDSTNGSFSDSLLAPTNSTKDFQKTRMSRSSVFPTDFYSQPEDSLNQEMISIVERTMKKHTDNLMRFLEGLSSRLSQLELYCYNVDKSVVEMRADLLRGHGEANTKMKSLDKQLQEVHRSVQILRDKQELAETQKELAKLQVEQKESSSEEKTVTPKKTEDASEVQNQQLALALPSQVAPQPPRPVEQQQSLVPPSQTPAPTVNQLPPYYMPPGQLPNPQSQAVVSQAPYMPAAHVAPQPSQSQVNQAPPAQPYPQYPQQWPQQVAQAPQPPQQPAMQTQNQIRPPPSATYPPYMTSQPGNPPPPETITSSMSMQGPYSGIPQPGYSRGDALPYGYGGAGAGAPGQPQPSKSGFPNQPVDGYGHTAAHMPAPSGGTYMMYDGEGGRPHPPPQQPQYSPGGYPPRNVPVQNLPPPSNAGQMGRDQRAPQYARNSPHNELIDKLMSMGYRGDHVASVIQRLEESGQPIDFNTVLDRLDGSSTGGVRRGW